MEGLNNYMERQGNHARHKSKTGEGLVVPNSTVRSRDLDVRKEKM